MNERGQIAIFVILAIIIVSVIALMFVFPKANVFSSDINPTSYLRNCIEPEVKNIMELINVQGGYSNPDNFVMYKGKNIQYLCYTSEYYVPCVVQQPLLISHVGEEVKNFVEPKAKQCVRDLESQYESQGYSVRATPGEIVVDIIPGNIEVNFDSPMVVSKDESTQTFQKFGVSIKSEIYDLLSTAISIIDFESTYGDSETTLYLNYYPNLRIDKTKRNGDTIYKLSNVNSGDEFTFASRSLVWPQGLS
jgi:hypothetical protein